MNTTAADPFFSISDLARAKAAIAQRGWCVIRDIACDADNRSLIELGRQIGKTSMQGSHSGARNLENEGVNRVEAMDQPLRDAVGNEVLSSNAAEFPLHTDDSYSPQPARYVLMHCWRSDPQGGVSRQADVNDILAKAEASLIQRLGAVRYPLPFGWGYVLQRDAQDQWVLRFNRRDMHGFALLHQTQLTQQQSADLLAFENLAMQCLQEVHLKEGDCIIADNYRMLHGRSAFDASSGRLIKRLRILE